MTTTYNRNGDGTGTFVISITAEQTRFEEILYNFGLSIVGEENKEAFDLLTTQQQLNLIETYIKNSAKSRDRYIQEWIAEQSLVIDDIW